MITVDFPDLTTQHDDEALILTSGAPLRILSSAVVGGGFTVAHTIINRHVSKDYNVADPVEDLRDFAAGRGIDGVFVGLLTAVWMRKVRAASFCDGALRVSVIISAGVRNATCVGVSAPYRASAGTINTIILIDGDVSPSAMVNAILTATEAKTATLYDRAVKTYEGESATGTSTDSVVVACTGRGIVCEYAGPITPVGYLIGVGVRQVLGDALDAD